MELEEKKITKSELKGYETFKRGMHEYEYEGTFYRVEKKGTKNYIIFKQRLKAFQYVAESHESSALTALLEYLNSKTQPYYDLKRGE